MTEPKRKPPRCTGLTGGGNRCTKAALEGTTRCAHHSFKVPGRPTKLNAEITEVIVNTVLEGAYAEVAAQVAGINKTTLYRWLRKADDLEAKALEHVTPEDGGDIYEHVDPADWVYLDFRHALKSAEAYSEAELLRKVIGGKGGWQAFMTVLERRHPTRWRRRDSVEHSGGLDVRPVTVTPEPERREEILDVLRTATGTTTTKPKTKAKRKAPAKKRGPK